MPSSVAVGTPGSSFEIRAARVDEVEAVLATYEWLFAPPGSKPDLWDDRRAAVAMREAIESHDAVVVVAVEPGPDGPGREAEEPEDVLVGVCTGYQDMHSVRFGYRAWVEDLAVHPDRRSEGIGKALLDAAKAWAKERGATHLELDSSEARPDAHRFYEREQPTWRSRCYGWVL